MLFSELQEKDVINIRDCKNLGNVCDLEFDPCTGQIIKLIIGSRGKLCNLFSCEPDCVVCFKDIKQIGSDIILVNV